MFEFFNNILKAWRESSSGQRFGLVIFLTIIVVGVGLYEKHTATFRLTKLERAAQIINYISLSASADTNAVADISHSIIFQLKEIVSPSSSISPSHSLFTRFRYGLVFWIMMSLLFILSAIRKGEGEIKAAYGSLAYGAIIAAIAMFLPEGFWPWLHVFIYPILSLVILLLFLALIGYANDKKNSNKT